MGNKTTLHEKENEVPAFKIVLAGAPKSGKSSVFLRYIKNQHLPYYTATRKPVIENVVRKLNIPGHAIVSVTMWDLPGREDIDLRSTYFRNVDAAIVVVDMSDDQSIEMAGVWRREILNQATRTQPLNSQQTGLVESENKTHTVSIQPDDIPILLLGNKYDIIDKQIHSAMEEESLKSTEDLQMEESELQEVKNHRWNYNPSFPPQRKPEVWEEKHDSVKLLETICEENNFTASVMVSCSDNDGSVEGAIQSLIRHLVTTKYPDSVEKWKHVSDRNSQKTPTILSSELETVDIPQLDEIFVKCEEIIRHVDAVCEFQDLSLARFKEACFNLGVLDSRKANMEECIGCIREAFPDDNPLQVTDKEGFFDLEVQISREINLRKDIKIVFDVFNIEFAASSRLILKEFPSCVSALKTREEEIGELSEDQDLLVGQGLEHEAQLQQNQWKVERNRAKIEFIRQKAQSACNYTKDLAEKISLAMIW